jgi:bacterioferritin-associated ferredoxin
MSKENLVCSCKKISKETIVNAIKNGSTALDEVKKTTQATTGICCGIRCKKKVKALINEYK